MGWQVKGHSGRFYKSGTSRSRFCFALAGLVLQQEFLLVANQLPSGRGDVETVAALVSVIDLAARGVVKELQLPNGSGSLKDLAFRRTATTRQ